MRFRRALPLSLVALLASVGCVSTGPETAPGPDADPARGSSAPAVPGTKPPVAPRRARQAKPAPPRTPRQPAPPSAPHDPCAAAEGSVPPSIVDLCIRQYGH
ncbi:hypothetical protein [Streptomyces sp. NPDC056387]|uniref:hypothetical protein n=1 Tax=Streptomyces sp. NPDC056387 TaxID=3345803 RepID=UPI0035D87374